MEPVTSISWHGVGIEIMITATGLGSGLDIDALVTGIVDAERVPLMGRLDTKKSSR